MFVFSFFHNLNVLCYFVCALFCCKHIYQNMLFCENILCQYQFNFHKPFKQYCLVSFSYFLFHLTLSTKHLTLTNAFPASIYLFKVNNRNTRTRCEICSKLTIKTPERRQRCRYSVFIVNFEHISHLVLVFLLLTLSR